MRSKEPASPEFPLWLLLRSLLPGSYDFSLYWPLRQLALNVFKLLSVNLAPRIAFLEDIQGALLRWAAFWLALVDQPSNQQNNAGNNGDQNKNMINQPKNP